MRTKLVQGMFATALVISTTALSAGEPSMATLEKQFRELPMEAKRLTGPLFWLHGDESKQRLETYLDKVAESGNGCFTAESRPHKDWLGEGWYRDLDICLQAAKKHDLKMWIFDERFWPSQGMDGRVPPKYAAKTLATQDVDVEGPRDFQADGHAGERYIATLAGKISADGKIDGATLVDLNSSISGGHLSWQVPAGKWKVMKFTHVQAPGLYQNYSGGPQLSVDGASRDCTEWYIKTVYQPHFDHFGKDFGKTIPGFFYDEPETKGDWGTELNSTLAAWKVDWKKAYVAYKFGLAGEDDIAARYQYLDAFAETWGRTMYGGLADWCRKHNVVSMGHFMEHDFLYLKREFCAGDLMRLQKYSDMGGVDMICQHLYPGQRTAHAYQISKLCSSVSHVFNKANNLTMCEIFGAYGQSLTYPQMKWITDQVQVRGANFMIPHSFNPREPFDTDCPPYFYNDGYEPRYPLYRVYADYTSRLSLLLAGGRHACPIAVLFSGISKQVGNMVTPEDMTSAIQDAVYDCDWLPYEVFEQKTRIEDKELCLYLERYQVLVVPPAEVIPYTTLEKVKAFFENGGTVIGYGFLPSKSATIGKTSADIAALRRAVWGDSVKTGTAICKQSGRGGKSYFLPEKPTGAEITQVLAKDAGVPPVLEVLAGDTGSWLHVLHRVKSGQDVFLICNQNSDDKARQFKFRAIAKGTPEIWDPMRNDVCSVPFQRNGKTVEFSLALEPMESVLLVFQNKARKIPVRLSGNSSPTRIIPVEDARPLDQRTPPARLVVQKATYGVPGDLQRSRDVKERLQQMIDAGQSSLFIASLADGGDPAFGVVKTLEAECTAGDKRIVFKGTDRETISLRGASSHPNQDLGVIAAGRPYTASPVEADPFHGTCYIPADLNLERERVCLELDGLAPEAAASVLVQGKFAGGFLGKPFRLDITKHLKVGSNVIRIVPFAPKTVRLAVYPL